MSLLLAIVATCAVALIVLLLIGIYEKNTNAVCMSRRALVGRTALVTGGTAGMGLELARELALRGARVIIACPCAQEGESALQHLRANVPDNLNLQFRLLDLSSFTSTRRFVTELRASEERLDILINNAGVGGPTGVLSEDSINFVMQVNYYGAFLLTLLLLPLLRRSGREGEPSRIINVSSASYILGREYLENTFLCVIPPLSYFNSKLYMVVFTRELAKRLKGSNVVVNSADPGAVGTKIFLTISRFGFIFTFIFWVLFKNPWQGAQTALHVALDKAAGEVNGQYFKNCKRTETAKIACDEKLAMRLWDRSVKIVKLTEEERLTI